MLFRSMTIGLLSLMGFPGTFGFIGKWALLSASVADGERTLAVVLVLTSVVSAGYYLPVIMSMYMRKSPGPGTYADVRLGRPAAIAVAIATVAVLLFGILPGGFRVGGAPHWSITGYSDRSATGLQTVVTSDQPPTH